MENKQIEMLVRKHMKKDMYGKRDLCSLYSDREAFQQVVNTLAEKFNGRADYVASPAPMGFILGTALAEKLGVGFIPLRNANVYHLDADDSFRASYIDHSDNVRSLRIRKTDELKGRRIIIADDWISTAATMTACLTVMEEAEAAVSGIACIGAEYTEFTKKMFDTGLLTCIIENK